MFKRVIASCLIGISMLTIPQIAYADTTTANNYNNTYTEANENLGNQLNDLYKQVGQHLNVDYMYVKILHLLAGGKAVYADELPIINSETTVQNIAGPFDIDGATQAYSNKADWVYCPDDSISRPSKYYLPDAAYNVTASVVKIMNKRYYADRGNMQAYFDALIPAVKTEILFCESVMIYTGSSDAAVNNFYPTYEKILYDKQTNENVVETDENGNCKLKDAFKQVLVDNGISTDREIQMLTTIFSFDSSLAAYNNPDSIKNSYVTPYKVGYTSRENMMIAAMSLTGKCRYVWGGGHAGTGEIKGINPAWALFNSAYPTTPGTPGYNACIKPSSSWCPLHGSTDACDNGCLGESKVVYSADQYLAERAGALNVSSISDDKFRNLLDSSINLSKGVQSHQLDGLDCSGFASWMYNQIDSSRKYDSDSGGFVSNCGLQSISPGNTLYAGDVFGWSAHIIVIVGAVETGSQAYVIIEQSPPYVKFGVLYFNGASSNDINEAYEVAKEANTLLGNVNASVNVNRFNGNGISGTLGRLKSAYIDENTAVSSDSKTIKEMTAQEIIQHTIDKLPEQYLSGLGTYSGSLFNTDSAKVNTAQTTDEYSKENKANSKTGTIEELVDVAG